MPRPSSDARLARARARVVPSLGARVVSRVPLLYRRGADEAMDRPAHVRAGSALARLDTTTFAVVQDDASFLAVLEGVGARGGARELVVRDVALPSLDGVRQFDEGRGNKHLKLDLEACVVFPAAYGGGAGPVLVAFGSGSTRARERVVVIERPAAEDARVTVVEARALYAAMHDEAVFCGSELNVEGAALAGDDVLFLQRGNGACAGERLPVDASVRADARALLAYLLGLARGEEDVACPPLRDVVQWDLGEAGGTRLTFTDAVALGPRAEGGDAGGRDAGGGAAGGGARWTTAFVACAEASPDATRDGPVSGVVIGRLDDGARIAELALVRDEHGAPLLDKAEGIAFDVFERDTSHTDRTDDPRDGGVRRAWLVVDRDDPNVPAELLELHLDEGWTR